MGGKKVVIVTLLVIAVVLSSFSILMNISAMNDVNFLEVLTQPETSDVSIVILPPKTVFWGLAG